MNQFHSQRRVLPILLFSLLLGLLTTGLLLHTLAAAAAPPAPVVANDRGGTYTQTLPIVVQPITLNPVTLNCSDNDWQLTWEESSPELDYFELDEDHAPDFSSANTYTTTNTFYDFSYLPGIDNVYYYRVRAIVGGLPGQWSNTQMVVGAYFDDFNTPGTGWPVGNLGPGVHSYLNGKYVIETLYAGFLNGTLAPDANRVDYIVAADINFDASLPTNGTYGLVFGSNQTASHYYFVAVYPSFGDFRVWRWDGNLYAISPYTAMAAINSGSGVNHVEVARVGTGIKVTINGVVGGTWTDNVLTGGTRTGVFVSSQESSPNVQAQYDNFGVHYCDSLSGAQGGAAHGGAGTVPPAADPGPMTAVPFASPIDLRRP